MKATRDAPANRAAILRTENIVPVESKAFRDAMSRLGAAVHIITTDGPGGRAGFTASAVCSVTDTPPTLLVCLNRSSSVHATFAANKVIGVNTLASKHEALSTLFGGKTPLDERFAAAAWSRLTTGAPILDEALVAFDCRIVETISQGTHDVFFCEVAAIATAETAEGLFYFGRRYHNLTG